MRRSSACALLAAGVLAPLLWAHPASADPGYPPTGPAGGGGTVSGGGQASGGGAVTSGGGTVVPVSQNLPRTGQDLQTAGLVGGGSILAGSLLLLGARRARTRRSPAPA